MKSCAGTASESNGKPWRKTPNGLDIPATIPYANSIVARFAPPVPAKARVFAFLAHLHTRSAQARGRAI
jgi:hypothetical protein